MAASRTRNETIEAVATRLVRTVTGITPEDAQAVAEQSVGLFDNRPALRALLLRYGKLNRALDTAPDRIQAEEARRASILFLFSIAGITPAEWLGDDEDDR